MKPKESDLAPSEGSSWLTKLSIPTALGGIALALFGAEKLDAPLPERPNTGALVSAPGAGIILTLGEKPSKAFDPESHMASIQSSFGDSLERKRLIITLTPEQKSQLAEFTDNYLRAHPPSS